MATAQTSTAVIEQTKEIQPSPGTDAAAVQVRTHADLSKEYVTSGNWGFLASMARALTAYIDDITRDFGTDQYDRMLRDAQIASVVKVLVMAVLADAPAFPPAVDKEDPKFEQAKRISDFCTKVLMKLKHPLIQVLYEMVEGALVNGHKAAEQVYATEPFEGETGPKLVLKALKPRAQTSLAFVMDAYMNHLGYLYAKPGQRLPLSGLVPFGDVSQQEGSIYEIIDPEKFALLSHLTKDGDLRGTSVLRCVFTPWLMKQEVFKELLAYLARFGSGTIIGNTAPDSQPDPLTGETPEQKMVTELEKVKNGAVGAFPPGALVNILEASGAGEPFFHTLELADRQIAKGVLLQTLATEEAKHMARSAGSIHQDVFGLLIMFVKGMVISMLSTDVLTPLVRYNFGKEALALLPRVTLGEVEQQDFSTYANGVAALAKAGLLHDSQYAPLMEMLKLPPADEEAVQADKAKKEALAAQIAAQPKQDPKQQDGSQPGDNNSDPNADDNQGDGSPADNNNQNKGGTNDGTSNDNSNG